MQRRSSWSLGQGIRVLTAERIGGQWLISGVAGGSGVCPDCRKRSTRRYGWHERHLQDLPAQGAPVTVKLRLQRWQCQNGACTRKTFTAQLPEVAAPRARRTDWAAEVVYLFGHGVGGRPGERLSKRIGMPTSNDTILRCLKPTERFGAKDDVPAVFRGLSVTPLVRRLRARPAPFSRKLKHVVTQGVFQISNGYWRSGAIRNAKRQRLRRLFRGRSLLIPRLDVRSRRLWPQRSASSRVDC